MQRRSMASAAVSDASTGFGGAGSSNRSYFADDGFSFGGGGSSSAANIASGATGLGTPYTPRKDLELSGIGMFPNNSSFGGAAAATGVRSAGRMSGAGILKTPSNSGLGLGFGSLNTAAHTPSAFSFSSMPGGSVGSGGSSELDISGVAEPVYPSVQSSGRTGRGSLKDLDETRRNQLQRADFTPHLRHRNSTHMVAPLKSLREQMADLPPATAPPQDEYDTVGSTVAGSPFVSDVSPIRNHAGATLDGASSASGSSLFSQLNHSQQTSANDNNTFTDTITETRTMPSSASAMPTCTVTVFGYPPNTVDRILPRFLAFGDVVHREEGYNWIDLTYKTPGMAETALASNGAVVNHVMIGVKRKQHDPRRTAGAGARDSAAGFANTPGPVNSRVTGPNVNFADNRMNGTLNGTDDSIYLPTVRRNLCQQLMAFLFNWN